jgi:hypothetical protein
MSFMNVKKNSRTRIIAQFFDNDIGHITKFQSILPRIESIHINDTIPNQKLGVENRDQYLSLPNRTKVYCDHPDFGGNTYAMASSGDGECTMPCEGISNALIDTIITIYASSSDNSDKYIFFDWDRTLSVVEGILSPPLGTSFDAYSISINDILLYLIGNQERINKLKNMYDLLKNNTKIYIITNNNMASKSKRESNRPEFLRIVQGLFEDFPDNNIISSIDYDGDKVRALEGKLGNLEIFKDRTLNQPQKGGKKPKSKPKSDKKIKSK